MSQVDPSASPTDALLLFEAKELVQKLNMAVAQLVERGFEVKIDVMAQLYVSKAEMPIITIRVYREV